ncbi:protein charybde-like [Sitophilus oryzae]|uniref:Protein charybde-like n=1 Tax=Sitophilus oryzae TaxID=7048 RepID=A0A6J2XMK2_SITOR|nr:protein charybde-like [Sitophilus oryzae]
MFRSSFQEESLAKDSKLQAVFTKLSGVLPRAEDFQGNTIPKIMSSDIIESVLADSPVPVTTNNWSNDQFCHPHHNHRNHHHQSQTTPPGGTLLEDVIGDDIISNAATLTRRLEQELRAAKRSHLACGEVLLPCGLLQRVARDIASMAESEPCGLRGCHLYVIFEPQGGLPTTRIGKIQCDPGTACTFELYLTLKQSSNGWNFLPQFIRNLTRGGTVVLSPAYMLSKKKLYRSHADQPLVEK